MTQRPAYRADIDGLRGIAIILVVLFHAFPTLVPGGFVGVDVFFVISGFLISGLIHDAVALGSFSFADFYGRRIRRIFPALGLMLLTVIALGWWALLGDELQQLGRHVVGAATFVTNLLLWRESGYFDVSSDVKPLLHLWSVSVEEQFYLIWPLALVAAMRMRMNARRFAAVIAIASFAWSLYTLPHSTAAAYYSPLCRFWELMVGAWLAVGPRPRLPAPALMSIAGLSVIALTAMLIDRHSAFPGMLALLPVMATAIVILAGESAFTNRRVLSQRILVWIGLISYPLYLWHWPLLSMARIVESGEPALYLRIAIVVIGVALAAVTYRLWERPLRIRPVTLRLSAALCVLLIAAGVSGYALYSHGGYPARISDNARIQLQLSEQHFSGAGCDASLTAFDRNHCEVAGDGPRTVLLIGDSHVRHSFFIVKEQLLAQGFRVVALSKGGCPFLIGATTTNVPECEAANEEVLRFIERQKGLAGIILAAEYTAYTGALLAPTSTASGGDTEPVLSRSLRTTLQRLSPRPVVFMQQIPPLSFDPRACVPRPVRLTSKARGCAVPRSDVDRDVALYRAQTQPVLAQFPNVTSFDVTPALCDAATCTAENLGDVLYFNKTHLNALGAALVARRAPPLAFARVAKARIE